MSFIDFEPKPQPQSQPSFSEWLQQSWENPHPLGVFAMIKRGLNIAPDLINASIAATGPAPSTEEEAFLYNLARDRGVIGALGAASTFGPASPQFVGSAIGRYVANKPIPQALVERPRGHPSGARSSNPPSPNTALVPPDRSRTGGLPPSSPIGSVPIVTPPAANLPSSGGLLGRLRELEAIERRSAGNAGLISPEKDPNFRQLSRFPLLPTLEASGSAASHFLDIPDFLRRVPKPPNPDSVVTEQTDEPPRTSSYGGGNGTGRRGGGGGGGGNSRKPRRKDDDPCGERLSEELRRCESYKDDVAHPAYFHGCTRRAKDRWALCYKHGGTDHGGPGEWRPGTDAWPGDEETWRNYNR